MSYTNKSVGCPIKLMNEIEECRTKHNLSFSRFFQNAARRHIKYLEEKNIKAYVASLSDKERELCKKELDKG